MTQETNNLAAYIWSLADLLRGDFRQSQYGRIILPFALLRRLECVLEASKEAVLKQVPVVEKMNLPEEAQEKLLLRATNGLSFLHHLVEQVGIVELADEFCELEVIKNLSCIFGETLDVTLQISLDARLAQRPQIHGRGIEKGQAIGGA